MMDYGKLLSPVVQEVRPSGIRKFFDIANTMKDVISLGVGEPDFPTPWEIRKAGILSLEAGRTRYTANRGLEQLREEISRWMARKYALEYDPASEILVTVGGSEAIDGTIRAVVCQGDEVIIPQPSYVCYEPLVRMAGGVPVILETTAEHDFKVTPEMLRGALSDRTKLLILPYPCNPTGGVMERADLEKIADVLRGTNVLILSDEIYSELTFGGLRHVSAASVPGMRERTVVVNGFSKSHAMTGWRMGYVCGPAPIVKQMLKLHQFGIMSAPTTSQYAAIEAMRNGDHDIEKMRDEYDGRRRYLVEGLRRIGLPCFEPRGAFYVFPDIRPTGLSSEEFCERFLMEEKVAVIAGNAFGPSGEGFVRCCYATSMKDLSEALTRMEHFLANLKKK